VYKTIMMKESSRSDHRQLSGNLHLKLGDFAGKRGKFILLKNKDMRAPHCSHLGIFSCGVGIMCFQSVSALLKVI